MKVGQTIEFYLFGGKEKGTLSQKNDDGTWNIEVYDITYPKVQTLTKLPKKRSDNPSSKSYVPPWYILK